MNDKFFVILGNQLFDPNILKAAGCRHVLMAEDYGLCTYQKHHKLKIYLFLCAMREYRDELRNNGLKVSYYTLEERTEGSSYSELLINFMRQNGLDKANFYEIEDQFFEHSIVREIKRNDLKIEFHRSPMFMFSRDEFETMHRDKKRFRLADFYKVGRKKFNVLIDDNFEPVGNKWSFDDENRKKIPDSVIIPKLGRPTPSKYHNAIIDLIERYFTDHPGKLNNIWFPVTRQGARDNFNLFLSERLSNFGVYEDAMRMDENFLFHSCISPFLNVGLLTPDYIIQEITQCFLNKRAPINSVEGYIRQILGWREFIRGIYQVRGVEQAESNFWSHKRLLNTSWYDGSTGIAPLDDCIKTAIKDGYSHHIPRLMVISNLMNLCEINPKNIYKWFMEMYIDSSDWVMVPNVFGMATFSDGGLMSTKPYTCGSNYILKMSNYKKGDWCDIVDGLYWRFINKHKTFYQSNPRLSFQIKMLERLSAERKAKIFKRAENFLKMHTRNLET